MPGHMPIRLIVADLDGTLLNSAHALSPANERAIREAQARGVRFTVATGKSYGSTLDLIRCFDIQIPIIASNGTQVFWPDGTLLHADPIPHEVALDVTRVGLSRGFVPVIYTRTGTIAEVIDANVREIMAHHEPEPEVVPSLIAALESGRYADKLVLMSQDHAALAAFYAELAAPLAGRAQLVWSGLASLFEVMPARVSKATALRVILDRLGIAPEETLALGDNCNDFEMIRLAGVGVAMGQAPADVQAGADYVARSHDEDGVAEAIQRFVLDAAPDVMREERA